MIFFDLLDEEMFTKKFFFLLPLPLPYGISPNV